MAAAAAASAAAPSVNASSAETEARDAIRAMANSLLATLAAGANRTQRERHFRALYRRYFYNDGIAVWAAGRVFAPAAPEVKREYLEVFEDYIVTAYAALLAKYKGERLRVDGSEMNGHDVIVVSHLVNPNPRESREIEMRWIFYRVGVRLLLRDVVIDKISMALTERRAFAEWTSETGGTLAGLVAVIRKKIVYWAKY